MRSASTPNESSPPPGDGSRSPAHSSSRKELSSQLIVSPSLDPSISQGYGVPPSSNTKSRVTAERPPSATVQSSSLDQNDFENQSFAPLSPRYNGPGSVLQRMNTIVPGPFQLGSKADFLQSRHKKTSSMSSSKDFTYPSIARGSPSHSQRPSTSGSIKASKPFHSSISERRRDRDGSRSFHLPPIPTHLESSHQTTPIEKSSQENRSNTYLLNKSSNVKLDESTPSSEKLSQPSLHVTKPSIAIDSAMGPPPETGNAETIKSSGSNEARNYRLGNSPPASISSQPLDSKVDSQSHTPTDSVASHYSSGSDSRRSGSSTSTPPQSGSPQRQKRGPFDRDPISSLNTDISLTKELSTAARDAALPHRIAPPKFNRPTYSRSIDEIGKSASGSTAIRSIQSGRPLVTSPDSYFSPQLPLQTETFDPSVPLLKTAPTPSTRRPKKASKGNCKGCKEPIHGKSVSSADGRLTGRYHKQCFVCNTCREPFQTADFYILDDQPYCERHYHLLNNSVCTHCDQGIEGQYLETELKQKFHPKCFTCQVSSQSDKVSKVKTKADY